MTIGSSNWGEVQAERCGQNPLLQLGLEYSHFPQTHALIPLLTMQMKAIGPQPPFLEFLPYFGIGPSLL